MAKHEKATLTVPTDTGFLQLVRTFTRELARMAGLEEGRAEALVVATDEACTNIIKHAFEPGEAGSFNVEGDISPSSLVVSIRDRGLPFDPSSMPDYTPPLTSDPQQATARGLGFYLIRQAVDEARWIHRGKEGKELRLAVGREEPDITQQLPEQELVPFDEEVPRAKEQAYTVRGLRPDEAIQVSQCIYRAYGYTYPMEDLYYPDRIVRMNETGELLSAVAVAEDGAVVGHYALERPDLGIVAESGQAVVMPAHRGQKLMERMRVFLTEEAEKLGLQGIYSQPVTSHVYSQRVNERFGSRVAGITLGLVPRELRFKKIKSEPLPQRETVMLYFKSLGEPRRAVIHAPGHHRKMLERLYTNLERSVTFEVGVPLAGPSRVSVHFHKGLEAGFFFSGVGPCFAPDGDTLRLQYLNTELDIGRLQLYNPFAKELAAYIATERERVT
jgi:anti-sigma regulatory factor (Ser/Thr protein kinase)/RimJ/RimL family protein N-acetyltransferase